MKLLSFFEYFSIYMIALKKKIFEKLLRRPEVEAGKIA
jgi:hypothetical protein